MKGRDVKVLQGYLTRIGLRTKTDGEYGPRTTRRVMTWERRNVRPTDGKVSLDDAQALRDQVSIVSMGGVQYKPPAPPQPPAPEPAPDQPPPAAGERFELGPDGLAIAPASAPPEVKAMVEAANKIHDKRYRYGGGHVPKPDSRSCDSGCDCSGSLSYVFQQAGLMKASLDSTGFMSWGDAGKGEWVTVYAHGGHAYMIFGNETVGTLRFDTSGMDDKSRWDTRKRSSRGYTVRHPEGL